MALSMASLHSTKSGAFVARKATPQDARAEYKRLYGVGHEAILKMPLARDHEVDGSLSYQGLSGDPRFTDGAWRLLIHRVPRRITPVH
jgi:hypothetical protein